MKTLSFHLLFLFAYCYSPAQLRHLVYLKNKDASTHSITQPSSFLSQRAIDRRIRYNIPIDSSDIPVPADYILQVKNIPGLKILNTSRWLNAIAVEVDDPNALVSLAALPFVKNSAAVAYRSTNITDNIQADSMEPVTLSRSLQSQEGNYFDYGASSFNEIHLHKGEFLHNIGLRGQTMQIAILDGGFFHYTSLDAMDSAVNNQQVLSTWDFVNNEPSVTEDNAHGMMCLSTIAANIPGQFIGKAPKAFFHLFITENPNSESLMEEFNWICGAERADSTGADIISSSLGYNTFDSPGFNHSYSDLDGNTTLITEGADMAARKGLLIFNANGNAGAGAWHYLLAPADADSVVAVGAVNTQGTVWPNSSYGPSSDGRIKPDISSIGFSAMVQGPGNTIVSGNGTSFACPNMAGLATCLWQGFPEFNNMRIARSLREASDHYHAPDDRTGYGIPDLTLAFSTLLTEYATSSATENACVVTLQWKSKDIGAMRYEIERKAPGETSFSKIGDLHAQGGTVLANRHYQFSNPLTNTLSGLFAYRIRQVVDTNTSTFSAVYIDTATAIVNMGCMPTPVSALDPDAVRIMLSPNPSNTGAKLLVHTPHAVRELRISVYDMKGILVVQSRHSKPPGSSFIDLPVHQLAKGKYMIRVFDKANLVGSTEMMRL